MMPSLPSATSSTWRVREHGDEDIDLRGNVARRSASLGAAANQLVHRALAPAVHNHGVPGLDEVLGHGTAHDPKPNHSNGLRHGQSSRGHGSGGYAVEPARREVTQARAKSQA